MDIFFLGVSVFIFFVCFVFLALYIGSKQYPLAGLWAVNVGLAGFCISIGVAKLLG